MEFIEYFLLSFFCIGLAIHNVNAAISNSINTRILEKYRLPDISDNKSKGIRGSSSIDGTYNLAIANKLLYNNKNNNVINTGTIFSKQNDMLKASSNIDGLRHKLNSHQNSFHHIEKRDTLSFEKNLKLLLKNDPKLAVLYFIEYMIDQASNCKDGSSTIKEMQPHINSTIEDSFYQMFNLQIQATIRTSNILNTLFKTKYIAPHPLYFDGYYYALAKSLVESNRTVFGTVIAFEGMEYYSEKLKKRVYFAPYVYRGKDPRAKGNKTIISANLADQVLTYNKLYTDNDPRYDWFWNVRQKTWEINRNGICQSNDTKLVPVLTQKHGQWFGPSFSCVDGFPKQWIMSYSVPFFGCRLENTRNNEYNLKGVVNVKIDLEQVDIDQCTNDTTRPFADTHKCNRTSTKCVHQPGRGFRRGSYKCVCKDGFYFDDGNGNKDGHHFNGSEVERLYVMYVLKDSPNYEKEFNCLPCAPGCTTCTNSSACFADYDIVIRGVPLGITSFCMTIALVMAYSLVRLRKSKVMKASFWLLLEIFIFGALLLYSTIIIQFFVPTRYTCLLLPWFREVGFAIVYGALVLKVYRVLAEFQSRKAHRVHVRDKDLLKWLFCIVCVVIGYMSAWTALNLDHIHDGSTIIDIGRTPEGLDYTICKSSMWDVLIEIGEFIYLCFGIHLCYCIRSAPSDYLETRYISWAIYNETLISAILHIARHILWLITNPDYIFLMYFIRCQLTVTVNLALVLGPKIFYSYRPPEDESYRNRAYSTSDVQDNILPESVKLHVGVNSNGDVDVGEINLSEMDPEDIRTELKRLYTQLQIYKTKTMRKDNPHISKRRGGRKHTHRRFSLQAFHHKHRHHHHHHPSASEVSMDHDTEMSRTPEESTNSNEGYGYSMEESTCSVAEARTPTVTFKPGHKTIY